MDSGELGFRIAPVLFRSEKEGMGCCKMMGRMFWEFVGVGCFEMGNPLGFTAK